VEDVEAVDGKAVFTALVSPDGVEGLEYSWQRLDMEAWETAPKDAEQEDYWRDMSGEDGRKLKLEGLAQEGFARYQYRCRVTAGDLTFVSEAARVSALTYTPGESPEVSPETSPEESPEDVPNDAPEESPETVDASPEELPEATPEASPETTPEATVEPSPEPSPEAEAAMIPKAATSGSCGDNVTWSYADGTLTITGTGAMRNFTQYDRLANAYSSSITRVVIGSGVTSVGNYAFYYYRLTSVTLPSGLTSIGNYAFAYTKLTGISLPSGLTSIGV
jgi:hypothetical protein